MVPTCPHTPLESHFVETHSDAARKTRPAFVSSAPARTTAAPPFPDCLPPSGTFASSPDRSHPLPSAATPAFFVPRPSVSDSADPSPGPYCWTVQTVAPLAAPPHSHRPTPPLLRIAC